jgi:hypothetical protein
VKFVQPFIFTLCIAETLNFYVVIKVVQTGNHYGEYTVPIFSGHSQVMVRALLIHELNAFQTVRKPLALQLATCCKTVRLLSNFPCIK